MVFAKALPFARFAIGKPFTHGYAQSLVASSHSWNATQNLQNRFQKHQPVGYSSVANNGNHYTTKQNGQTDSGLVEYYKEWQHIQKIGAQWRQHQFARRIEWKPHTLTAESAPEHVEDVVKSSSSAVVESRPPDSAIDVSDSIREDALTKLDGVLPEDVSSESNTSQTLSSKIPNVSSESIAYTNQLVDLAARKQYADIPAVFESMLNLDIVPTTAAYNALLAAAIHLPRNKHDSVDKALNVYADMLQRQVFPDSETYSMLIEKLTSHSVSVLASRSLLESNLSRYGQRNKFLFKSTEAEYDVLQKDDSLNMALRLFDSAISIFPKGPFSDRAFQSLLSACAESNKISDMVNILSKMESQSIVPRADAFIQMLPGFARINDIDNSIELYNEYKKLAVANNNGDVSMVRKDLDIYAAMLKSFIIAGDEATAFEFMEKLEASSTDKQYLGNLRDTVVLKGFLSQWLKDGKFDKAYNLAQSKLSPQARDVGFAAICIRSADQSNFDMALQCFGSLSEKADITEPALAMSALQTRQGNVGEAERYWRMIESGPTRFELLDLATIYAVSLIEAGRADIGLSRLRSVSSRLRNSYGTEQEVLGRIDESIEVLVDHLRDHGIVLPSIISMQLVSAMMENHGAIPSIAAHLLAGFGPDDINSLTMTDLQTLMQVQASVLVAGDHLDIASNSRFAHILDVLVASGVEPIQQTRDSIEQALAKLDRPELFSRWNSRHVPTLAHAFSPFQSAIPPVQPSVDDSVDPYFATTDNKGSITIADLLEKHHGIFSKQLDEALNRFKNMRRAGRHPRFFTYAKLISAAAKDNRLSLAQEILQLARKDVPYLAQYRIVRHGWISILDSMVAACLQCGHRQEAGQYHQELLSIGAAPSSNTFGLYITTLKESTKTFDEASEAVKIFLQAKSEGVEPTSFLYNALIGKLGKARRIDDCLFYFQEMRALGIRPTSVTYGTIVNALCRVSDEKFAEELFEEMENMPNYKPRPAPYHSMMQFFLTTKRDRSKVLSYYQRMSARGIPPTAHTFKLLIDAHASIEPIDMMAAGKVLEQIQAHGMKADAVHYAALIHANGCVAHDLLASRQLFDKVMADRSIRPQPCLYQAMFESMVANHAVADTIPLIADMKAKGVELTPYIANALIHGWALEGKIDEAEAVFARVARDKREPSTYEAMTRAYVVADLKDRAMGVVNEALAHGYPAAVANKIVDLVGGNKSNELA